MKRFAPPGFHPENRFGAGIEPGDLYELLAKICSRGCSKPKVAGARCFEIADGAEGDEQKRINVAVAVMSNGLLTKPDVADIRLMPVACTHTTNALRCVEQGAKPPEGWEDECDHDERLS